MKNNELCVMLGVPVSPQTSYSQSIYTYRTEKPN